MATGKWEPQWGDKRLAFLLVDVVNGADVGVIEAGDGTELTLEALQRVMVFGHFFRQEFDRNEAVKLNVLSLVDNTHASAPKLLQDPAMGDGSAGHLSSSTYHKESPDVRVY